MRAINFGFLHLLISVNILCAGYLRFEHAGGNSYNIVGYGEFGEFVVITNQQTFMRGWVKSEHPWLFCLESKYINFPESYNIPDWPFDDGFKGVYFSKVTMNQPHDPTLIFEESSIGSVIVYWDFKWDKEQFQESSQHSIAAIYEVDPTFNHTPILHDVIDITETQFDSYYLIHFCYAWLMEYNWPFKTYDLNNDSIINYEDLAYLLEYWVGYK